MMCSSALCGYLSNIEQFYVISYIAILHLWNRPISLFGETKKLLDDSQIINPRMSDHFQCV